MSRRALWLIAGVAALVIATKLVVEDWLGLRFDDTVVPWIADAGATGAALVVGLLIVDLVLPVPSSLVMIVSGAAFGMWWGSLFSLAGSVAGEWIGFELARRFGTRLPRWLLDPADTARLQSLGGRVGAAAVLTTRAVPVAMETISLVAGLARMRRSTFLWASLAGTAPIALVYAWAGAVSRDTGSMVPAVVILIAVTAAGWLWYRASRG